ncbi:MAG: carbamoyltransferase HypF [Arcobacteraceae bacterium]|nr:carbamoyltransferase HypF [Arcobacteraceae bacterium]
MIRNKYQIKGVVQGVGFRPYIYTLATRFNLSGFVYNDSQGVTIELQGKVCDIELFDETFLDELPPLAHIDNFEKHPIPLKDETTFCIIESIHEENMGKTTLISPDIAVCMDCLEDIKNGGKYHNYFATNCTNCGPRYSIIETVPYDRKNSSMKSFTMCESCKEEYQNPLDRRYHAQPISCSHCGPKLELRVKNEELKIEGDEIFSLTARLIKEGKIGAFKGIGGFHLVCDSTNDKVIKQLRQYKNRPTKPFALMCKNLAQIEQFAFISDKERELLTSKEAPIVILEKLKVNSLKLKISNNLAPNISKIGCFLPYSPLHHLLFEHLESPIVATSANLGDEPIITKSEDIAKLLPFIDFILDFNRDIVNGVDDSLVQIVDEKIQILRLGRGYAPKVITLPFKLSQNILAVGGSGKNTISLAFEDKIIISPHIGDLDSFKAFEYFTRTIETFKRFYDFKPDIIVCDKHPNYETTKWANELKVKNEKLKVVKVQHHLAHIYSVKAEFGLSSDYLGFSFDGTGYGEDGTIWGGEVFVGDVRKYHFKQIKLLGGEKAIKEPRRVALSMLFERYSLDEIFSKRVLKHRTFDLPLLKTFTQNEIKLLHQSYEKNLNAPLTSSVGRLFDGVASLANLTHFQSYEGEAGLLCEMAYDKNIADSFPYSLENNIIDIEFDFFDRNLVSKFINTLVDIVIKIAQKEQLEVILSGGVFQNKTLLELVIQKLKDENINYHHNQKTPTNDGGISLGQIYYAFSHLHD